eukprot:scaffold83017_cov36-Cyclotella_meneghiniana.AAC.1
MAMVEVPGGSAVGSRSNHRRRTTPFFLEGRLEKPRGERSEKNQVPTDGETHVTIPFISLGTIELGVKGMGFYSSIPFTTLTVELGV